MGQWCYGLLTTMATGRSGVKYIAAPMGSQADAAVAETCEKLGITLVEQSVSGTPPNIQFYWEV